MYLNTDTYITHSMAEIIQTLDFVDFAGTIESAWEFWYCSQERLQLPGALPEINVGVLAFNNTPEVIYTLKS